MIPKEIALQLVELKEKSKTYSAIQRSYKIDEIRTDIARINNEITGLTRNVNNTLTDGLISKFEIDNWFAGLKDKSDFSESNPRLVYEEEQQELERQRKVAEEKARQERVEYLKHLKTKRIEEYQNLCYYGPDDFDKVKQLIKDGFDIKQDGKIYDLSTLINLGRSLKFIEFLIEAGMKVNEDEQQVLERQIKISEERVKQKLEEIERQKKFEEEKAKREAEEHQNRLEAQRKEKQEEIERQLRKAEVEARQKREELERQKKKDDESARQKQSEIERKRQVAKEIAKKEAEERQKRLQAQRIQEFRKMCYDSFYEDINKLKELIEEGLDINNINDFDCLQTCISWGRSLAFIKFLVDSGILVKNTHIDYCYANSKHIKNSASIISILEKAENIEDDAVKNIIKRINNAVIGSISLSCICIFFLFMPQILDREMDSGYYVLTGMMTILSLLMAIFFIVELRKKPKRTNIIHLPGNQLPRRKQTGSEIPNAQGIIDSAESVKEFNHKEIKKRKLIFWIVVTLILISTIALIYIYFEEVIAFLKVALILVVIIALFIWRYSPTKRR